MNWNFIKNLFYINSTFYELSITILLAILVPFIVLILFRIRRYKLRNKFSTGEDFKEKDKNSLFLPGSFNSNVVCKLSQTSIKKNIKPTPENNKIYTEYNVLSNSFSNEKKSKNENRKDNIKNNEKNVEGKCLSNEECNNNKKQFPQSSILNIFNKQTTNELKSLNNVELHGKLATAQLRVKANQIEQNMTEEERNKENEIRNKQLAAIFELMLADCNKYGLANENDLVEQMKLYSI